MRQGINIDITDRFGFIRGPTQECGTPVSFNTPVQPRANSLKTRLSLIQPYSDRPNRGGAHNDEVPPAIIVDVCCLYTEAGYALRDIRRQTKAGATRCEMDANLINVATLPNRRCLRYMISIQIMSELRPVRNAMAGIVVRRGRPAGGE